MKLRLDFAPKAQAKPAYRLGLGTLMLSLLLGIAWSLTNETEAGLPQTERLQPAEAEVLAINQAIDQLNFPWVELMTLLEGSIDDSVRLIQFEADVHDSRLTLHGEARDTRAVLELPNRLRASSLVSDARIVSQRVASPQVASAYPIHFALEVTLQGKNGEQP